MKPEMEEDKVMNAGQISTQWSLLAIISTAAACFILLGAAPASLRAATITVCSTGDNGPGTLRAALAVASNGDTIDLYSCAFGTILLTSGQLVVTNGVSIIGPGDGSVRINGNYSSRVFYVGSNATVTIAGLTITQGFHLNTAGGIWNDHSTLTVTNCALNSNEVGNCGQVSNGGGIYNSGTLTVVASTLSGNVASGCGGEGGNGGAIYSSGMMTVGNSTINSNSVTYGLYSGGWGGGIFNQGMLTVTNCAFTSNSAGYVGGGMSNYGTGTVSACTLSSNTSAWAGGIDNYQSGVLTVINCTLSGNSATNGGGSGGGIDNQDMMTVKNCTLSGNSTTGGGGAIVNFGTLTVSACTLSGNSAASGGGINNLGNISDPYSPVLTVSNSTLSGNSATGQGGGIFNTNGTLSVYANTLSGNSAISGGGIYNTGPSAQMQIGNTILNAGISGRTSRMFPAPFSFRAATTSAAIRRAVTITAPDPAVCLMPRATSAILIPCLVHWPITAVRPLPMRCCRAVRPLTKARVSA